MSNKRGPKKHMAAVGQDFFALGATSATSAAQSKLSAPKRTEPFQPPISMSSSKRPKLSMTAGLSMPGTSAGPPSIMPGSMPKTTRNWEDKAIVVPTVELKDKILQYDTESDSEEMIERLLCGAAKQLREQKTKPDSCLVFTLLYLAKIRPLFFCSNIIVEAFSSLLKREHLIHFKSKNNMVPVLLINLFHYAFHDENSWPELFIRLYVEDSLGDRIWVDNDDCKEFVDIIVASFRTKLPPKSMLQTSDVLNPTTKHVEVTATQCEDSIGEESCSSNASGNAFYDHGNLTGGQQAITSRYLDNENVIINYVCDIINENLNRRPTMSDISRNMLKLLSATAGIRNVRFMVAQKLEHWYQSPKLSRPAQDLLLTIFLNCDDKDGDTLNSLLKMRLKNKPFISHFLQCFRELLNHKNGTFEIVLKILFTNELSGIRNMNNIQLISIMFQQNPVEATLIMSRFFFSMIYTKEDHLRILRNLLREIVRVMKSEPLNFPLFVSSLLEESHRFMLDPGFDISLKEKVITEIVDIVTMAIFLSVNQNIREAFSRTDRREIVRNFQLKISTIQCKTVTWLHRVMFGYQDVGGGKESLPILIRKALLMEPMEYYCKLDNWPSENERNVIQRLTSEGIPLQEETVQAILAMGFDRDIRLAPQDACEIIWTLLHHATMNFDGDLVNYPVLCLNNFDIINLLFQCSTYVCPEDARFPENYVPPKLARIDLYWKVWFMLVVMAAHIPIKFGAVAWKSFPMFRALVEMAITNNFQFPPKSMDTEDMQNKMAQMAQLEKINILQFETFLARDHEINEANSYLINTLVALDPASPVPRRPPAQILNDFKLLCNNNRLNYLLCQSRQPDFLLMIIDQQQSLPGSLNWLIELVESYESNYGLLPVQCLCEFLLRQVSEECSMAHSGGALGEVTKLERVKRKDKRRKLLKLIGHFQNELMQTPQEKINPALQYLIRYLSHSRSSTRMNAYKALHAIVTINVERFLQEENLSTPLFGDEQPEWFKTHLIKYLKSEAQIQAMCMALTAALGEESNPTLICQYLDFIAEFVTRPGDSLVFKCSMLLIQRRKIPDFIILYGQDALRRSFLSSLYKIYQLYIDSVLGNQPVAERIEGRYVYLRLPGMDKICYVPYYVVFGVILSLSYGTDCPVSVKSHYESLSKLFLQEPYPSIFKDQECKHPEPLVPEWLILRLFSSDSPQIIAMVMASIKPEIIVKYIDSYGLSMVALQKILQSLDKMNAQDSRSIKSINLDKPRLLASVQCYWSKGINYGYKFAKVHLNYKPGDNEEKIEDIEMTDVESQSSGKKSGKASGKKDDDRTMELRPSETFRRDDIRKMFEEREFQRKLPLLSRLVMTELLDSTSKNTKKLTKQFLMEFDDYISDLVEEIKLGTFNSIFNIILVSVAKESSKNNSLNQDLAAIKKSMQSLNLEGTLFWKCFDRLFHKDNPKTKKSKKTAAAVASKKSTTAPKVPSNYQESVTLLKKSLTPNEPWLDTYNDLAVEKFYKKDTDAENFNEHLQTVIFSRNRPYFLSLLLHKSNFSTLNDCIKFILAEKTDGQSDNQSSIEEPLNPTAVLDFLQNCIDSPKLWIGRDNDSQKVVKHEDVLNLNYRQMKKLIGYVVEENNLSSRIDLVIRTCCVNSSKTEMVVDFLRDRYHRDELREKIATELHTRIYLQIPAVELNIKINDDHFRLMQSLPSFMDKLSHHLISSFLFIESQGSLPSLSQSHFRYWELAMLKVAAKHPVLFIRQLPMIPAMLRGKVNAVNYEVFRNLNLLRIFSKLLNVLNLLRPYLWNRNHAHHRDEILNLYMDMFLSYYQLPRQKEPNHELLPVIIKFIRLIDNWVKYDCETANSWIKQHKKDFTELSVAYSNEHMLFRSIITGVPLPDEAGILVTSSPHFRQLQINIKTPQGVMKCPQEILMSTLSDINKLLDKFPSLGDTFLHSIQSYYQNPVVSDLSLNITLKALQANPNTARSIIASYIKCLQNESPTVTKNALLYLPEFVLLAQDYRYLLLRKVFELAISGSPNATPSLVECFRALASELGCNF